jgi:hypothetical protein
MDRWKRAKATVCRVARFSALSFARGVATFWMPVRVLSKVTGAVGVSLVILAATGLGIVLGVDPWLAVSGGIILLLLVLLTGAYRLWDQLEKERRPASLGTSVDLWKHTGTIGPDEHQFGLSGEDPVRVIDLTSERGAARAVQFREPTEKRVNRHGENDPPQTIRWGPFWQRRRLRVTGFTATELQVERLSEPFPDNIVVEVYYDDT